MAMECDHVDILALSQALDTGIHIVSMEGDEQQLVHHIIPEGAEPSLHLLYQTSHYNILYLRPHLWPVIRQVPHQLRASVYLQSWKALHFILFNVYVVWKINENIEKVCFQISLECVNKSCIVKDFMNREVIKNNVSADYLLYFCHLSITR